MPDFVPEALDQRGLMDLYRQRPPYQQNDCIGSLYVARAKQEATKKKHLQQMLDELERGNVYMNMEWEKR